MSNPTLNTLRELKSSIRTALRTESVALAVPETFIEFGKYGVMPTKTPAIWVYAEPQSMLTERTRSSVRTATITIACLHKTDDDALELGERVEKVLAESSIELLTLAPAQMDGVYADVATVVLTATALYQPSV